MPAPLIDRNFVRLAEGLVHYRSCGSLQRSAKRPLYMAHAGPGSSRGMIPLMQALGDERPLLAPDMLGNGDSDPPAREVTDIAYYADAAVRMLDALGVDRVDFYGSHTGALIGMEMALYHKDRIGKLIVDGVLLFTPEEKADLLAHYAPKITIDDHGGYLSWAYQFIRDMSLFWPYYRRTPETRMANGTAPPEMIHASMLDVLKAIKTYHIAYNAAFAYDVEAALAQIRLPTLFTCSSWDPMHVFLQTAADMVPGSSAHLLDRSQPQSDKARLLVDFLDA